MFKLTIAEVHLTLCKSAIDNYPVFSYIDSSIGIRTATGVSPKILEAGS